jgi:hypothetical protein
LLIPFAQTKKYNCIVRLSNKAVKIQSIAFIDFNQTEENMRVAFASQRKPKKHNRIVCLTNEAQEKKN